jgi:hypothetical protein
VLVAVLRFAVYYGIEAAAFFAVLVAVVRVAVQSGIAVVPETALVLLGASGSWVIVFPI